jgi:hypothetical protein
MSYDEFQSLARRNRIEAIVVEHHKRKAETGPENEQAAAIPPLDQLPDDPPLISPAAVYHKIRSLNAVRHGLTGQTVVMPWEDRQEYDKFCQAFLADLKPVGFEQTQHAQTVADCQWRLNRASSYESAIFFYEGYLALHEEEVEMEMCKARVAMTVEKHLLNIALYESRIQRKMMNARKALKELQKEQADSRSEAAVMAAADPSRDRQGAVQPAPDLVAPVVSAAVVPKAAAGPVDFVFSDLETFCAPPRPAPLKAAQIASQSAKTSSDFPTELENLLK